MSTTINLTNVIAAKGYGGADLVAIYGQGGVAIWEATSGDYLALVAKNTGTFAFSGSTTANKIQYSTDNGKTWSTAQQNATVNVNNGDIVLWKGEMTPSSTYPNYGIGYFTNSTAEFDVEGNVMSLLYGDNFDRQTDLTGKNYTFYNLFKSSKCVNANNLILPATTLANNCYQYMFNGCTLLENVPELPATTLANTCYSYMFSGCTSLTTPPELSATALAQWCYNQMFSGCTSLTTAPVLSATTLAQNCYTYMFSGCTSLTTAPVLPATTLVNGCYTNMFSECTSLTTPPILSATTLADNCYTNMFSGCTSLAVAPSLPATTLASRCYDNMLSGTNLLPDCSNIDFTSQSVVASGGLRGLFAGTKVTDNDLRNILPINQTTNHYCLPVLTLGDSSYNTMFIGCTSLTTPPELPATTLTQSCYSSMFKGCTSLTTAPVLPATTLANRCYMMMFMGCTSLTAAPSLPATTLYQWCYEQMFKDCTSLTAAPSILPAPSLIDYCYQKMFDGCAALTTSPMISATIISSQHALQQMFNYCTSLNYIKAMFTQTPSTYQAEGFTSHVAATGIFVKNINATWTTTGNSGVPTGWTVIYYDSTADKYYLSDKTTECDDHGNPIAHNYANDPFTIVAKSAGDINIEIGLYYTDGESESGSGSGDGESPSVVEVQYEVQYSTDGGTTWDLGYVMFGDEMTFTVQAGDEIMLRNDSVVVASDPNNYDLQNPIQISQSTTASFELQGNIMSLIYGEYFDGKTSLTYGNHDFRFTQMFYNCTTLTSAENLVMPATTLPSTCYNLMFAGCTALTKSPVLPATTLTNSCYSGMFGRCTSLNHITMLATDISASNCLGGWVDGVAATGTFVKAAAMTSLPTGASGIPSGWNVQDAT